jgi:cysteinyl-tRNA synthetase
MESLNVEPPDVEPRATEYVREMIEFIEGLIKKGHAYESQGDVYFDVRSLKSYGRLTRQKLEDMVSGAREQVHSQSDLEDRKKYPADFALWKGAPEGEPGWASPWGNGRPGWHLECSAMIKNVLGETIDLHGGGEDLLFPHHENEIAQSEGLHGKPLARFFVHNSFVQVNNEKMAKSLGNFKTIQDILKEFSSDDVRLFVLQTHYRNPIDFSPEGLQAARSGVQKLVKTAQLAELKKDGKVAAIEPNEHNGDAVEQLLKSVRNHFESHTKEILAHPKAQDFERDFAEAMDNDFNTAMAVGHLFTFADQIGKETNLADKQKLAAVLKFYGQILGLKLTSEKKEVSATKAAHLVDLVLTIRQDSKKKKDYATSDLIRTELTKCGINVMDGAEGSSWEIVD